jgi:hypothetical protein
MVNATEMAKVFGKRVDVFMKTDHAQAFIEALLSTPNGGDKLKFSKDEIIKTNKKGGTWMHRILALKFAAWLDPKFEVWVWLTIDKILLGHYREVKVAVYEKMKAERARDEMREKLIKENPEFIQFLQLEGKISESEAKRRKALNASMAQFKLEFQNS